MDKYTTYSRKTVTIDHQTTANVFKITIAANEDDKERIIWLDYYEFATLMELGYPIVAPHKQR